MIKWICVPEEGKDGKTYWNRIGKLIDSANGKQYVKIFHIQGLCSVFEDKPKAEHASKREEPEVNLDDQEISF